MKEFARAAGIRAAKTFIQVILSLWLPGTLITEVDWKFVLVTAVSAAVLSLLTSILTGLPEVPGPPSNFIETTHEEVANYILEEEKDLNDGN